MPNPLVGARAFSVHPEADGLHEYGLRAALGGDLDAAHAHFTAAQEVLVGLPQSADVIVQRARVARDDGFTYLRGAIKESDSEVINQAEATIEEAIGSTLLLIIKAGDTSPESEPPLDLNQKQLKELYAEHGATVSLLGRLGTVKEVVFGLENEDEAAKESFLTAFTFLDKGSNGYYFVNNTMVAARQERLHNRSPSMWLGCAVYGLARTTVRDPRNLLDATRTFGSRLRHVRSYNAAAESVRVYP